MLPVLPVEMFQAVDKNAAGTWLADQRAQGRVAAAFLYADHLGTNQHGWGTLFTCMPAGTGITLACHDAVKSRFHVQVFVQGEQIALWLKDVDVEVACQLLAGGVLPMQSNR